MLKSIYISNFAIIDELELDFGSGMNVLTGETGTGKSIMIDALNLALGSRADSSMARSPERRIEIVATLDTGHTPTALDWLEAHGLDTAQGACVLRRVISKDGKSKAYINGSPCPVMQLRSIGELLVDVYGQHECQSLMRRDKQRELLDGYAGHDMQALGTLFRCWKDLNRQLESAEDNREHALSQLELLRYQCQELEQLGLDEDEYEALNERHVQLSHAKALNEGSLRISSRLAGDLDETVCDTLGQLLADLEKLSAIDRALEPTLEDLNTAQIQLAETAHALRDYSEQVLADPQELQQLEDRISEIEDVARKHKVRPAELPALHASLAVELENLETRHEDPEEIRKAMLDTEQRYRTLAGEISSARHSAAEALDKKITGSMQTLGMQGGQFHVEVQPRKSSEPGSNGLDELRFLVRTNPGQSLRPLDKVVSGGELSRLSLAIQITTANNLGIPTLIFDEVDAGVGGATAEIIGQHLRKLSDNAQVFCVTHLAQVAAQAHHHYKVSKHEHDSSVRAEISQLAEQARVDELARMLGGIEMTRNIQEHAREMLQQTQGQPA